MADEVRKNNPVLAVGTGAGVGKFISLGGRRSRGSGPAQIELPKEQQEELERRQKAAERAKLAPKRVAKAAQPPPPPASTLPAITPLVLLAIQNPTPKPKYVLVAEPDVLRVTPGQSRDAVLASLGTPSSFAAVNGLEDGKREVLTYHVAPDRAFAIRLLGDRVVSVSPN
jgi:hypothetical protein